MFLWSLPIEIKIFYIKNDFFSIKLLLTIILYTRIYAFEDKQG